MLTATRRALAGLYSHLPGCWGCLGKNPHNYSHHFSPSIRQGQTSNRRESDIMNLVKDITSAKLINVEKCSDGLVEGGELNLTLSYTFVFVGRSKLLLWL